MALRLVSVWLYVKACFMGFNYRLFANPPIDCTFISYSEDSYTYETAFTYICSLFT